MRAGRRCIDIVEVHQLQSLPRDLRERRRIARQPPKHAGAALGCLVEKDGAPAVARRHRLGQHLAFLELEDNLKTARKRVLQGGERSFGQCRSGQLKQQRVLVVLDDRHDALLVPAWRGRRRPLHSCFRSSARSRGR